MNQTVSEEGPVAGRCKHGKGPYGSTKCADFLECLSQFLHDCCCMQLDVWYWIKCLV
jgi:hypothetical protein